MHLKSFVCVCGPDVLSVGSGPDAQSVLRRIERQATYRYATVTLPDDKAANVLFVNGHLVHRSRDEAPKSDAVTATSGLDLLRVTSPTFLYSWPGILHKARLSSHSRCHIGVFQDNLNEDHFFALHNAQEIKTR